MAELFIKQAKQYLVTRPTYPQQLFQFIASNTPCHDLAWDVATGSGQAATSIAPIYNKVIGTDTSPKQLELAPKLPNVEYKCTPANISMDYLDSHIAAKSTVDLVTIAQALHWFDNPSFYQQVKHVLKKPHGVIAAWCYTVPQVNASIDAVFKPFYTVDSGPFWDPARKKVDNEYRTIDFPFEPVDGLDHTGPFEFKTEKLMNLSEYLMYIRSWSSYQTAKDKGVELLNDGVVEEFTRAWGEDGTQSKTVVFPIYLRIGKVVSLDS
ncbi:uncharacterized protein LOC141690257 [Apium graveolens]|uniref:uncharacterized protein LOC141690257 n=1 Tax=Apium graveolens TaxID=4045 RepID=UPI003D79FDD5